VFALCEADWDRPVMCKALWSYKAQMPCDLTFAAGKDHASCISVPHSNMGKLYIKCGPVVRQNKSRLWCISNEVVTFIRIIYRCCNLL